MTFTIYTIMDDIGKCPLTDADVEQFGEQRLRPLVRHTLHDAQKYRYGTDISAESNGVSASAAWSIITVTASAFAAIL